MRTLFLVVTLAACAAPESSPRYITIGTDALETVGAVGAFDVVERDGDTMMITIDERDLPALSERMHAEHHRCGGFMLHDSLEDARAALHPLAPRAIEYTLDHANVVAQVLPTLDPAAIVDTITGLSAHKTRYYQSASGARAALWLRDRWRGFTTRRDITIELVDHGYEQKSVVLTIPGTTRPNEVVVIGGHLDSISPGGFSGTAPGADDDASGIATLTEVLRGLLAKDYRPERTIKFMAYAAEEVGLRGSLSIARDYQRRNVDVVGALQLDMTNYQGSDKDIWIIEDFTNAAQNTFLIQLIEAYVGATWGREKCGYACSDHASWHRTGVPASMPFESRFRESNNKIHTPQDTLERSGNNAAHAIKFARLATAYVIEMAKGELGGSVMSSTTTTVTALPDDDGDDHDHRGLLALGAFALLGLALALERSAR